jgi:AraC family transcriptional regulator, transcriptional activator of pobA
MRNRKKSRPTRKIPVFTEKESFSNPAYGDFIISSYRDEEPEEMKRVAPHRHTYYEIIWVQSGEGTHMIDFRNYPFKGPCLFLLHPQHIHTIEKQKATRGGVVKFSPSFFPPGAADQHLLIKYGVFDDIDVMPVIRLDKEQEKEIKKIFRDMLEAYRQRSSLSAEILASYLTIFILKIYAIKKNGVPAGSFHDQDFLRFRQFQQLLNDHFTRRHDRGFYADSLHISPKTLTNCTQKFTGRPPADLIRDRLMLEARRLLHHSSLSVKEIAHETGFEDSSYFIRFFTRHTQMSPKRFRDSH